MMQQVQPTLDLHGYEVPCLYARPMRMPRYCRGFAKQGEARQAPAVASAHLFTRFQRFDPPRPHPSD